MELWIVGGVIFAVCAVLLMGGNWMEARWNRMHPPDDWDGMREDKDDEHR